MKAVIIEDEHRNSARLRRLLAEHCPQVSVVGEGADADSGKQLIYSLQPELVFLDIQLPGKSGFDMLSEMGPCPFGVIFVSGYDQYGIQAIKCSAIDYLLKPVKAVELVEAVQKAQQTTSKKAQEEKIANLLSFFDPGNVKNQKIILQLMNETRLVQVSDIIFCEGDGSYTKLHMNNSEDMTVSKGLSWFDAQLLPFGFTRPHQSYLVNLHYIKSLLKNPVELLLINNQRVPVSRMKLEQVKLDLRLY